MYAKENQQADSLGPYRVIELKGSYVVVWDAIKGLKTIHLNNCRLMKPMEIIEIPPTDGDIQPLRKKK